MFLGLYEFMAVITTTLMYTENFLKLGYDHQSSSAVQLMTLTLYQLSHKGGNVNLL